MNKALELRNVMLQIQDYVKKNNRNITVEEITQDFINYGIPSELIGKLVDENSFKQIKSIIDKKINENTCSSTFTGILGYGWEFFYTNYPKNGLAPEFEWKMYVPIKPDHYGFVVTNIINFLCNNGIVSLCKFTASIRSDSMIINIVNSDDIEKIINYINSYEAIKSCIGEHQPFIPDFNGIGVIHCYDYITSYTGRLSKYLVRYVNSCRRQNKCELITADAFLEIMRNLLNKKMLDNPSPVEQIVENLDIILNHKGFKYFDKKTLREKRIY